MLINEFEWPKRRKSYERVNLNAHRRIQPPIYAKLAGAKCNSIAGLLILNDQRQNLIPICDADQVSEDIECSKH